MEISLRHTRLSKLNRLWIKNKAGLKSYLDELVDQYNRPKFIEKDPISIPHKFSKLQDIEISAFWVAMLSWGQRTTIVNKANELMVMMDMAPYDFIMNHNPTDLKALLKFKHRTFQPDDTLYFIDFFKRYYSEHHSLEKAFFHEVTDVKSALAQYHNRFFDIDYAPNRTRKHVSTPLRNSSCKRLNMFLRWMVRSDNRGVDFGLWKSIKPSKLMIPLDVHVFKVAQHLKLLTRTKADWTAVEELTQNLRRLDPNDPVKYDYALFSIGAEKRAITPL